MSPTSSCCICRLFISIVELDNLLFSFVLLPDMFILVKIKIFKFTSVQIEVQFSSAHCRRTGGGLVGTSRRALGAVGDTTASCWSQRELASQLKSTGPSRTEGRWVGGGLEALRGTLSRDPFEILARRRAALFRRSAGSSD